MKRAGTITVTVKNVADAAGVAMTSVYGWEFETTCNSNSAVAYVCVSGGSLNTLNNDITAYGVDANGQLTPVPGSPFNQNVGSLATIGKYLAAAAVVQPDLNTYTIASDGAITLASQFNYGGDTGYQSSGATICGLVRNLFFDRTGLSRYGEVGDIQCTNNNAVASFAVDSANGSVSYLGNTNIGYEASGNIAVLGNDAFAYSALDSGCMYGGISPFARSSKGLLTDLSTFTTTPQFGPPPPPGATNSAGERSSTTTSPGLILQGTSIVGGRLGER